MGILNSEWHNISLEEITCLFKVDLKYGLNLAEVELRKGQFGPNQATVGKQKGALQRFLTQFRQPFVYILVVASVITALLQEWVDSGVILGVVLVNVFVGFIQEAKAGKAIEALAKMITTEATVLRAGKNYRIPSVDLVPGDIVILKSGDKVPADLRLFHVREFQTDESALTGESAPIKKNLELLKSDTVLADRKNMAYTGTLVTYGQGTGIVVTTGDRTETGLISQSISTAHELATPLSRKLSKLSRVLLYVVGAIATLTFVVGLLQNHPVQDIFMASVALAVAIIPEGLPAAVTITLAIGVSRLAKRNSIIRKLPAVETLGSTTVICSDKTGTLTENQMTVREIFAGRIYYEVSGSGYSNSGRISCQGKPIESLESHYVLRECLMAGLLCNDSHLIETNGYVTVKGDPTEAALIIAAHKAGLYEHDIGDHLLRVDTIPFESQLQYMATLHNDKKYRSRQVIYVKGAVENILQRCVSYMMEGKEKEDEVLIPSVTEDVTQILNAAEKMGQKGLRVLAFACKNIDIDQLKENLSTSDLDTGLVFLGLQGMIDPPRDEAITAIRSCRDAGIQVKMITGDNVHTATFIASQIGLLNTARKDNPDVHSVTAITGYDIKKLSEEELTDIVEKINVFARVSPEQKLSLVRALQSREQIVAMTGDGVNDAPALKQADIGIAMGMSGTDVAKEAADMIITDDNFSSIEAAVQEGRTIFDNLIKFITWTLPTSFGEGLVLLAAIFTGQLLPILPIQILWVNMTTALALGMMLIFEPKEPDIMKRPPRSPVSPLLGTNFIVRIILVSIMILVSVFGLFMWELDKGTSDEGARTVAVNTIIFIEIFFLLNCRSLNKSMFQIGVLSNRMIPLGITIMIALQLIYTYLPAMNSTFHSAPLSPESWIWIIGVAMISYVLIEVEKAMQRFKTKRR